jgi:hypothetical protein
MSVDLSSNISFTSQANKRIPEFDDEASEPSKSSILKMILYVTHPEYEHAWHMEDDVFFTGGWNTFFDHADGCRR